MLNIGQYLENISTIEYVVSTTVIMVNGANIPNSFLSLEVGWVTKSERDNSSRNFNKIFYLIPFSKNLIWETSKSNNDRNILFFIIYLSVCYFFIVYKLVLRGCALKTYPSKTKLLDPKTYLLLLHWSTDNG